jgi:hypothetical protein
MLFKYFRLLGYNALQNVPKFWGTYCLHFRSNLRRVRVTETDRNDGSNKRQ